MKPNRKVTAGGLGGALALIVVWIIGGISSVEPPAEVGAALATVLTFGAAWLTREGSVVDE